MGYINVVGTLFDNSIDHTVAFASQLKDTRLNKKQDEINEELLNKLENVDTEKIEYIIQLKQQLTELQNELENLKSNLPKDNIKHIILDENEYAALENYEDNAIYFIIDAATSWSFGNKFPIIFGKNNNLGVFPIKLK